MKLPEQRGFVQDPPVLGNLYLFGEQQESVGSVVRTKGNLLHVFFLLLLLQTKRSSDWVLLFICSLDYSYFFILILKLFTR